MAMLKYKGYYQKTRDFSSRMIPSICQGFTEGSEHQPHILWYFLKHCKQRSIYYFLIPREWIWWKVYRNWNHFKERAIQLRGWDITKWISVLCLWIHIFKRTQKPCDLLPWNAARCIYTWAMRWSIFRKACELRFSIQVCKDVSH